MSNTESYHRIAKETGQAARRGFQSIRTATLEERSQILAKIRTLLGQPQKIEAILKENQKDLQVAKENALSPSMQERLLLNEKRIESIRTSVSEILELPDPIDRLLLERTLPNGLILKKKSTPLGVLFVIYESRPNVTMDVALMCIKSANSVILRGGKEARNSNRAFYEIILEALADSKFGVNSGVVQWVENNDRDFMKALLLQSDSIDLVIPRGGENLIRFISAHSRIPVVKHDKGVCNLFIDKTADYETAVSIAVNAKMQRPSVCNAIENILIHKEFTCSERLLNELASAGIRLLGNASLAAICDKVCLVASEKLDALYAQEFLDERLSVKIVADCSEGLKFIEKYGSGHSEAIVSQDPKNLDRFKRETDAAAVFVNCSTRFHDGGEMGFGAEIGISTTRIHARGPMGLNDLTSSSYFVLGNGQIRAN